MAGSIGIIVRMKEPEQTQMKSAGRRIGAQKPFEVSRYLGCQSTKKTLMAKVDRTSDRKGTGRKGTVLLGQL